MSTKEEKFDQYDQAYIDADDNYNDDIAAAKGKPELIDRIDANYARISGMWSLAKRLKLDANNDAIEVALGDAKAANKAVKDGRAAAAKITATVKKVDAVVSALATLTDELRKV